MAAVAPSNDTVVEETDGGVLSLPLEPPQDIAEFHLRTTHGNVGGNHGNRHLGDGSIHHHGNDAVAHSDVERYIHVGRRSLFKHFPTRVRIRMKAKAAVRPEFARFQLVDRRERLEKTLLESDWLPDERELSGQPFFLRPYYHFTNCLGVSGMEEGCRARLRGGGGGGGGGGLHFSLSGMSCHREGRCHMLFQLVRAVSSDE